MKRLAALVLLSCLSCLGCDIEDPEAREARMRDVQKRIEESVPKRQEEALAQDVSPEVVREAQERLRALHEYQDEPSGKLDFVTVNAIQAFQRSQRLEDDGVLDRETLARLRAATPESASDE